MRSVLAGWVDISLTSDETQYPSDDGIGLGVVGMEENVVENMIGELESGLEDNVVRYMDDEFELIILDDDHADHDQHQNDTEMLDLNPLKNY